MPKLWNVPGEVFEIFYINEEFAIVTGTTLSQTAPPQCDKFVGWVDAQLTDKDRLTVEGQKYCSDWGVDKSAQALRQWAECQKDKARRPQALAPKF